MSAVTDTVMETQMSHWQSLNSRPFKIMSSWQGGSFLGLTGTTPDTYVGAGWTASLILQGSLEMRQCGADGGHRTKRPGETMERDERREGPSSETDKRYRGRRGGCDLYHLLFYPSFNHRYLHTHQQLLNLRYADSVLALNNRPIYPTLTPKGGRNKCFNFYPRKYPSMKPIHYLIHNVTSYIRDNNTNCSIYTFGLSALQTLIAKT